MAKLDNIELSSIKEPENFMRYCARFCSNVFNVVNGKIEFDSNILSQTLDVVFPLADTDVAVAHSLGKTGLKFIPVKKTVACDVYHGSGTDTKGVIFLRSTVATTITIILC